METVRISKQVKLLLGLVVTSAVSLPISASATDLYVAKQDGTIDRITQSGVSSTFFTGLPGGSIGLAFDSSGNFYANLGSEIDKVTPSGVISKLIDVTSANGGYALAIDSSNNLYAGGNLGGTKLTPSGIRSSFVWGGNFTRGLAFDASNNLFISHFFGDIEKVTPSGVSSILANTGSGNNGLAVDTSGNIFVDQGSVIKKITPSGVITTFASGLRSNYLAIDAADNLYTVNDLRNATSAILKFTPSGAVSTFATGFSGTPFIASGPSAIVTPPSTSVPEPFTIVGTLVGGTAALRMRKKLKSTAKL